MDRCKNFFALGMCYWLYNRSMDTTLRWIEDKFKSKPVLVHANRMAMQAGYSYCEATEAFQITYEIPPAKLTPGLYRNISGNVALAMGFVAASQKADIPLFLGSYPITPASDILHELSKYKDFGVITFQAEDEIAAVTSAIGAAYGGALGITTTSGPGMSLKTEAMGLAVAVELPLVICDVQRGGPSTGLPTLPGQGDMMQARWGSHGDYETISISPNSPQECFDLMIDAFNLAEEYRTPVFFMMDEVVGHMTERVAIPPAEQIEVVERKWTAAKPGDYLPYATNGDQVPEMVKAGDGYRIHITGLTHDERGYPAMNPVAQDRLVRRLLGCWPES